jgi:hypothetical protein
VVLIFFHELLHPAGGIDQLLLAGEERMAGGADLDPDLLFHGADLHFVAAGAFGLYLVVFWMDVTFHLLFLLYLETSFIPEMMAPQNRSSQKIYWQLRRLTGQQPPGKITFIAVPSKNSSPLYRIAIFFQ